jgi:hypothetical protein
METPAAHPIPWKWRVLLVGLLVGGLWWWLGDLMADLLWHMGWALGQWLRS